MVASIIFGLKPVIFLLPMMSTGSDISPVAMSSSRAPGSVPMLRSVNGMPFCDRYSVALWQPPQPTFV
jgi:hypothetical protein